MSVKTLMNEQWSGIISGFPKESTDISESLAAGASKGLYHTTPISKVLCRTTPISQESVTLKNNVLRFSFGKIELFL